jgi:acetylornithine deacetylase/succinyl-diaminopimelate desuccinylase-like protein
MQASQKNLRILDSFDWGALYNEALGFFQRYIQLDTSNPPGNEEQSARFFEEILTKEGLECRVLTYPPDRGNIVARLRGNGIEKPLILLNHMDVVPVEKGEVWECEPFSGAIKDGYVWGRGALDMKGMGILELMAVLALKRHDIKLSRDIIFLATSAEETGGTEGVEFVFNEFPELAEAGFALNEGGGIRLTGKSATPVYCIGVAEKVALRLRLTTGGKGGHGSIHSDDSSILSLLRALTKIEGLAEPPLLIPATKQFFSAIAPLQEEELRDGFADIEKSLRDEEFVRLFARNGYYDAMVRNTKVITVLEAGHKLNVIPAKANGCVDCRLIPGVSKNEFLKRLKEHLGDEVAVEVVEEGRESPPSPVDTALYRAISNVARRLDENAVVAPFMMTGGSDSSLLRVKGIDTYGFVPYRLDVVEKQRVHGRNERLSLENLRFGLRALVDIILELEAESGR